MAVSTSPTPPLPAGSDKHIKGPGASLARSMMPRPSAIPSAAPLTLARVFSYSAAASRVSSSAALARFGSQAVRIGSRCFGCIDLVNRRYRINANAGPRRAAVVRDLRAPRLPDASKTLSHRAVPGLPFSPAAATADVRALCALRHLSDRRLGCGSRSRQQAVCLRLHLSRQVNRADELRGLMKSGGRVLLLGSAVPVGPKAVR